MFLTRFLIAASMCMAAISFCTEDLNAQAGRRGGFGVRGGGFGGGGARATTSEIGLLSMEKVIKHLQDDYDLSEEVSKKIADLIQESREGMREKGRTMMEGLREMESDERNEVMAEFRKESEAANKEASKKIGELLEKKQQNRLRELKFQRMGVALLHDKTFYDVLGISKEQAEKLAAAKKGFEEKQKKAQDEMRESVQEAMGEGGDRDSLREMMTEMRESIAEMQKKSETGYMDVLTKEQKEAFEKMKGEAFEFPARQRRGRGRGQ